VIANLTRCAHESGEQNLFITGGAAESAWPLPAAARDGAKHRIAAKNAEPHPNCGTIYSPREKSTPQAAEAAVASPIFAMPLLAECGATQAELFGGIDICVNNASAINLSRRGDRYPRFD